jgi:fructose-bisphosphate aldolase class II
VARITLRQLLDHAANHGYAVPAFNINNMEQGIAIMQAAAEVDAPVIIQASRGARSYAGDLMLSHMIDGPIRTFRSACTRTTAMTRRPAPPPSPTASPRS